MRKQKAYSDNLSLLLFMNLFITKFDYKDSDATAKTRGESWSSLRKCQDSLIALQDSSAFVLRFFFGWISISPDTSHKNILVSELDNRSVSE